MSSESRAIFTTEVGNRKSGSTFSATLGLVLISSKSLVHEDTNRRFSIMKNKYFFIVILLKFHVKIYAKGSHRRQRTELNTLSVTGIGACFGIKAFGSIPVKNGKVS